MTQQEYENKIRELQDELEQLKAAKIEAEQPKRWKPQDEEKYYIIKSDGSVDYQYWHNDGFDKLCYLTGNCFETAEEAYEYKKQIEYTARYKNYIEEHSEPLDWDNRNQAKFYAEFRYDNNCIIVNGFYYHKTQGAIYASSEQIIWDAIKEIGEYNFKKYVLGVK